MDDQQYADLFAKALDSAMYKVMTGGPAKAQPPRAVTFRYGRFETVELDAEGKIVEPSPRCCWGVVLHAPNCKTGFLCT